MVIKPEVVAYELGTIEVHPLEQYPMSPSDAINLAKNIQREHPGMRVIIIGKHIRVELPAAADDALLRSWRDQKEKSN